LILRIGPAEVSLKPRARMTCRQFVEEATASLSWESVQVSGTAGGICIPER
jgi:hypothetical protein